MEAIRVIGLWNKNCMRPNLRWFCGRPMDATEIPVLAYGHTKHSPWYFAICGMIFWPWQTAKKLVPACSIVQKDESLGFYKIFHEERLEKGGELLKEFGYFKRHPHLPGAHCHCMPLPPMSVSVCWYLVPNMKLCSQAQRRNEGLSLRLFSRDFNSIRVHLEFAPGDYLCGVAHLLYGHDILEERQNGLFYVLSAPNVRVVVNGEFWKVVAECSRGGWLARGSGAGGQLISRWASRDL
ncbi:hypothetical protein ACLOJK_030128 [Asimina triloba]